MKKSVKTPVFLTTILLLSFAAHAQLKLPSTSPLGNEIKKIVAEYPNRFSNLVGELITENAQSADFACNCTITGAEETTVTRYSSKGNNIYSWQTVMLTTESFEKAKQKFKSLYNQLNNLSVNPGGDKPFQLKAKYEVPREEKKFNSILFAFEPADESFSKLRTELALEFYPPMEWKVRILIYDRDREDDERGNVVEEIR